MATDNVLVIILKGLVHGLLWGLFYYYMRKGWNPANFGQHRQIIERRQEAGYGSKDDFFGDAFYGGLAAVFIYTLDKIAYRFLGV